MFDQRPSPELLRKVLRYDPETGYLFWRNRTPDMFNGRPGDSVVLCRKWNARHAGNRALSSSSNGYRVGRIFGEPYSAHRVIWAMLNGSWPENEIDHENKDRSDNRDSNLRDVSHQENTQNRKLSSTNTSGASGVYWRKDCNKWMVLIPFNGKMKSLGSFIEKSSAIEARKSAEIELGFHPGHGSD